MTLTLTIDETLKWLSSLPIVTHESFWWWQCSDRYIIFPFSSFSPSLISLMVSVDVKLDVDLLFGRHYGRAWPQPQVTRGVTSHSVISLHIACNFQYYSD